MRSASLIAIILVACTGCTTTLPPPLEDPRLDPEVAPTQEQTTGEFPTQVRIERDGMTCRAATRAARRALFRMGYVIDSVVLPEPGQPGEVRGQRNTGWRTGDAGDAYGVAVRVHCNDRGAVFEAATEEGLSERLAFTRDLPGEIDRAASQRTRRPKQEHSDLPPQELQVAVEPLRGRQAAAAIGTTPEAAGVMPIHIRIVNRSQLTYRFQLELLRLITEERVRQKPLAIDAVAKALAPEWAEQARSQQVRDREIAPGGTLDGYLYVRPAAYRKAKVVLIDTATEEAEGFSVEF